MRRIILVMASVLMCLAPIAVSASEIEPVYFEPVPTPDVPEIAVTRSHSPEELVPMYYEPSTDARLLGEYFDGVSINILDHVSDEWVFIDIHTYGAGGYGYMMAQDIAFGEEAKQVKRTTITYEYTEYFILNTHAMGQSGDIGPYSSGAQLELLGLVVSERSGLERPLQMEKCNLHVKIGDITGFLQSYWPDCLRKLGP